MHHPRRVRSPAVANAGVTASISVSVGSACSSVHCELAMWSQWFGFATASRSSRYGVVWTFLTREPIGLAKDVSSGETEDANFILKYANSVSSPTSTPPS